LDIYRHIHSRGVRLTGAHERLQGTHGLPDRTTISKQVLGLIEQGRIKVAPLLTHQMPAERAGDAYDMLLNHKEKALGVVLTW
jgi:threonine dehydrogenase-like Zn-dependent dehydrogenase